MGWLAAIAGEENCRCYANMPDPEEQETGVSPARRGVSLRFAGFLSASTGVLAALCTAAMLTAPGPAGSAVGATIELMAQIPVVSEASALRAKKTEFLFGELSAAEARAVATFAAGKLGCHTGYNSAPASILKECYLSGSEATTLLTVGKAAALKYLDEGGEAPERMAQVIVVHGDKPKDEGVGIYSVGPLDGLGNLLQGAKIELIKSVHFNRRPLDMSDSSVEVPVGKILRSLRPILLESFGGVFPLLKEDFKPKEDGVLWLLPSVNMMSSVKARIARVVFNWFKDPEHFQASWMHTIPFGMAVVQTGDVEEWYAENITYCGQTFPTAEDMLAAERKGTLRKCKGNFKSANTWDVPGPNEGSAAYLASPPPSRTVPVTWATLGNGAIRWGEWELFATIRPGPGLSMHDIRWRGERILYELGVSDAQAYYGAPDSGHQFHYSDKAYSLSQLSAELVDGLDCPHGATYFTNSIYMLEDTSKASSIIQGAIFSDPAKAVPRKLLCVFESDGSEGSMWRHAQLSTRTVRGRAQRSLVVRTVSTVGNYDYISEAHFCEDGSIKAKNIFAGYPEVDHIAPYEDPPTRRLQKERPKSDKADYGTLFRGDTVANLHAHYVVWKVDLDVGGTKNEFHVTKATHTAVGGGIPRKVQVDRVVEREDPEERFIAQPTSPGLWRIINKEKTGSFTDEPKGYAIMIETAPAVQTLPDSHPYAKASTFAKRHLTVTKRKEDEPQAVHSLDHYAVAEPLLSVEDFLADRESLVGEDLVAWVGVGKEHITRAEDIPLISNFGVGFSLMPWNYNDINPGMSLPMTHP